MPRSPIMNTNVNAQLQAVLNKSYALMQETQIYHWNVKGSAFFALHAAFEAQYTELFAAVDEIAERIVTNGGEAVLEPQSAHRINASADSQSMVKALSRSHEGVIKAWQDAQASAEKDGDEVSVDLAIGRISAHEKTLWMLRATIS